MANSLNIITLVVTVIIFICVIIILYFLNNARQTWTSVLKKFNIKSYLQGNPTQERVKLQVGGNSSNRAAVWMA
jgi:cell division protein FtsX